MLKQTLTKAQIRARLLEVLLAPDGLLLSRADVARKTGLHRSTVARWWPDVRPEAERRKNQPPVGPDEIADIERALLARAREGSVQAARLLFARMNLIDVHAVPDDDARLVDEIRQLVERRAHDESDDEGADE